MPQKFPGATRRDFTRNRVKGPKFPGATRRNPTNRAKRPKIFRRYAPGGAPPPDFPTHIRYVSTALFSNLAYHGAIILLPRGPIYRRALSRPTGILGAAPVELDARVLDSPTAADGCRHAKCGTTAAAVDRKQLAQRFKTRRVRCLNAACNCMEAAHSSGPGRWFGFRTLSAAGSCRKQMDSWRLEGVKWTG